MKRQSWIIVPCGKRWQRKTSVKGLLQRMRALLRDQRGATAIEYALIATAIFLAIVPPMVDIKSRMGTTYQQILSYFDSI
jgi:Flp pilus assembly pilin Flp